MRFLADRLHQPAISDIVHYMETLGQTSGDAVRDTQTFDLALARDAAQLLDDVAVPSYDLVCERERIRIAPLVTSLTYRIYTRASDDGRTVTYALCFYGTGYGSVGPQLLTDFAPFSRTMRVAMGDVSYRFFTSMSIHDSVMQDADAILAELAALARQHRRARTHRLCLSGYSLGAAQMLLFVLHFLSDAVQRDRRYRPIRVGRFASVDVPLFGYPSITCNDEMSAYIDASMRRFGALRYMPIATLNDVFVSSLFAIRAVRPTWSRLFLLNSPSGLHAVSGTSFASAAIAKMLDEIDLTRSESFEFLLHTLWVRFASHDIGFYIDALGDGWTQPATRNHRIRASKQRRRQRERDESREAHARRPIV